MGIFKKAVITESQREYKPLFDAFELTERYRQKGYSKKISLFKNQVQRILTREDLDAIEELNIKFKDDAPKLLNEIDTLVPNLKVLNVSTMSDVLLTEDEVKVLNSKVETIRANEKKYEYIDCMNYHNKLSDENMKHVFNLTKLEELRIPSQTHITKLDFSKMPNLKVVLAKNCINLKDIIGLNDNLFEYNYATYDFTGCEKISDQTIDEIAGKFDYNRFNGKILMPGHIFLPLNAMLRKNLKNQNNFVEFGKHYNRDAVLFSQYSNGVLLNHFASDTKKFCNELDNIIQSVCTDENNNFKKVYKLYRWVTSNVGFDLQTYDLEKQNYEQLNKCVDPAREAGVNRSEKTRSAIYILKKKQGVCVAISELFGDLVYRAGLAQEVRQVACSDKVVGHGMQAVANHQITAISFDKVGCYYFDPTGDLYRDKPIYFAKNKAETERKYTLSYRERFTNYSPSLYDLRSKDKDFSL